MNEFEFITYFICHSYASVHTLAVISHLVNIKKTVEIMLAKQYACSEEIFLFYGHSIQFIYFFL